MKHLIVLVSLFICTSMSAQSIEKLEQLKAYMLIENVQTEGGIQIHQFLDSCIYEHRCGRFSGDVIRNFGIVKGLVLTIDRRLRCNQLSRSQFLPIRINEKGLINDDWNDYRVETK